ncbi:hypothetical protein BSBH6_03436 [Bacillus subtilis]|nr:hypothetical protein BSBH6_03436 [Bacillus subtilis]RPK22630.1 hypothetical protein BH5_03442 [Bacillus subtilis]
MNTLFGTDSPVIRVLFLSKNKRRMPVTAKSPELRDEYAVK